MEISTVLFDLDGTIRDYKFSKVCTEKGWKENSTGG